MTTGSLRDNWFWKRWICHGPTLQSCTIFSTGSALNNHNYDRLYKKTQWESQSSYPSWDNWTIRQTPRSRICTKPSGRSGEGGKSVGLCDTDFWWHNLPTSQETTDSGQDIHWVAWGCPVLGPLPVPGSLEMKNMEVAPLAGTWQMLHGPVSDTFLHL